MSDCFDHAADAYGDLCFGQTADEGYQYRGSKSDFVSWKRTHCEYCGKGGLGWVKVEGRWRLKGINGFHVCPNLQRSK